MMNTVVYIYKFSVISCRSHIQLQYFTKVYEDILQNHLTVFRNRLYTNYLYNGNIDLLLQ